MAVCFNYFLSIAIFLNIDISQGIVATRLRCGGIFKYELVANLPVSLPVKEFWKSVNISGSYGQEFGVLFFSETQCILCMNNQILELPGGLTLVFAVYLIWWIPLFGVCSFSLMLQRLLIDYDKEEPPMPGLVSFIF